MDAATVGIIIFVILAMVLPGIKGRTHTPTAVKYYEINKD